MWEKGGAVLVAGKYLGHIKLHLMLAVEIHSVHTRAGSRCTEIVSWEIQLNIYNS